MKPYSVIDTYNQAVYDICPTLKTTYNKNNQIFVIGPMSRQKLINPDASGEEICMTIKATYHKVSTANLIRGGTFGASGVLEMEDMQKAINTDAKGNAKTIRACYGQCGFDSVFRGTGQGITGVMEQIEPKINLIGQYGSSQNNRIVGVDGISPCMVNGHKDGMPKIMEPNVLRQERTEECKQLRKKNVDKGMKLQQGNKQFVPRTGGISNTLSTSTKDDMLAIPELRMEDGCLVDRDGNRYRIRKLTPTECFRLMDVSDGDIAKILGTGISKTNLYKMAGNSIVVSCMFHIFRKLFIETEDENQQLSLF